MNKIKLSIKMLLLNAGLMVSNAYASDTWALNVDTSVSPRPVDFYLANYNVTDGNCNDTKEEFQKWLNDGATQGSNPKSSGCHPGAHWWYTSKSTQSVISLPGTLSSEEIRSEDTNAHSGFADYLMCVDDRYHCMVVRANKIYTSDGYEALSYKKSYINNNHYFTSDTDPLHHQRGVYVDSIKTWSPEKHKWNGTVKVKLDYSQLYSYDKNFVEMDKRTLVDANKTRVAEWASSYKGHCFVANPPAKESDGITINKMIAKDGTIAKDVIKCNVDENDDGFNEYLMPAFKLKECNINSGVHFEAEKDPKGEYKYKLACDCKGLYEGDGLNHDKAICINPSMDELY